MEDNAPTLNNRLGELLEKHDALFGVICRDATLTDVELMAQAGFHIVWFDMEHGPQSMAETLQLGRTATHLGMVPLVRMPELSRTQVQRLLDGGIQVLALPDVRTAEEAARFVQMGKYPPVGRRGVSSSSAGTAYTMGADPKQTLREVNDATHLMLMFESDEAYESLDEILAVDGIDMVTVGPMDWSVSLGLFGDEARTRQDAEIRAGLYGGGRVRQDCFGRSLQLRPGSPFLFLGRTCFLRRRRHCDQAPVSDRYAQ